MLALFDPSAWSLSLKTERSLESGEGRIRGLVLRRQRIAPIRWRRNALHTASGRIARRIRRFGTVHANSESRRNWMSGIGKVSPVARTTLWRGPTDSFFRYRGFSGTARFG